MSPDDIDNVVLNLHNFLFFQLGLPLDENEDYDMLSEFMHNALDKFTTRDRNYN